MNALLLLAALHCPVIVVENDTEYAWNERDGDALDSATHNCQKHYKRSPCLIKFIKKTKYDYHAICGVPRAKT